MKKIKKILIGFILLWILGFLLVWGVTILKKGNTKKMAVPGAAKEGNLLKNIQGADLKQEPPGPNQQATEAVEVRCYKVSRRDFKDDLPVMGTIRGALKINLKFEINGVIKAINFREGDMIYKGDLIATLDTKDAQLKVDYSKSKLDSAKIQYLAAKKKLEIHRHLYEIGGIIKAKLEEVELEAKNAESQVKTGEVELASAEAELDKTSLYAPRDGVMGSRDAEVGEFVTPQNKIATLYDITEVFVELGIVEKDIDKIALGQDVAVKVDAYPDKDFRGTVDNIFPVIEGKSRTLTVKVGVRNPDAMLLPGMFARAMITIAEFKNAIVIPSMSLNKTKEGYKIFTVDQGNTAKSRPVEVAYVTTDYTVIKSGVYEGELVVTDTPQELKDGMPVKVIDVQEAATGKQKD